MDMLERKIFLHDLRVHYQRNISKEEQEALENSRGYINNSLHLARKYARIFVRGHYLLRVANRERERYEEQIMSKDKYASIFLPQMEAFVFIIFQIFFATCTVLKIGEYFQIFPSFSWGIFTHVMHLDQSHASANI